MGFLVMVVMNGKMVRSWQVRSRMLQLHKGVKMVQKRLTNLRTFVAACDGAGAGLADLPRLIDRVGKSFPFDFADSMVFI